MEFLAVLCYSSRISRLKWYTFPVASSTLQCMGACMCTWPYNDIPLWPSSTWIHSSPQSGPIIIMSPLGLSVDMHLHLTARFPPGNNHCYRVVDTSTSNHVTASLCEFTLIDNQPVYTPWCRDIAAACTPEVATIHFLQKVLHRDNPWPFIGVLYSLKTYYSCTCSIETCSPASCGLMM